MIQMTDGHGRDFGKLEKMIAIGRPALCLGSAILAAALVCVLAAGALARAAEPVFSVRGIGGGGGIFSPSVSPFDPDFMLVCSDMSGVYYSHDGGTNWTMTPSRELYDTSRSKPAVFFRDRVYWYRFNSLVYSDDRGATWNGANPPWKPRRRIQGLTAVTAPRRLLFVATKQDLWRLDRDTESWDMVLEGECLPVIDLGHTLVVRSAGRVMVSQDMGDTWVPLHASIENMGEIEEMAGASEGSSSLLMATVKDEGVFRSTDEGRSWKRAAGYEHQKIIEIPPGQTRLVWMLQLNGLKGRNLWKSTDGGLSFENTFRYVGSDRNVDYSWVQTQMKWGYFFTRNGFYASHSDPDVAMVTTQGDFYITRDGGRTWHSLVNRPMGHLPDGTPKYESVGLEMTTCHQYLIDPWEPDRHYVAFTDIGFIRSLDAGRTWSYAAKGSPWPNTFYRVRFDPKIPGRMYAAAANRHDIPDWSQLAGWNKRWDIGGAVYSDNYGATWSAFEGLPVAPCTDLIVHLDEKTGERVFYAALYGEGVFVSRDSGRTWRDTTGNMRGKNMRPLRLWRNPDNGNLYCLFTALREIINGKNVMTPGGLWKSIDDGNSWTNLTGATPMVWMTAFMVDPRDERRIFMSTASIPAKRPHFGGIWRTTDGGQSWEHVLRTQDFRWAYGRMMAVAIHPDDPDLVYGGGQTTGLWISSNGGDSWKNVKSFPFRSVQGIDFDPADPSQMYLTTFGASVWVGPHLPKD